MPVREARAPEAAGLFALAKAQIMQDATEVVSLLASMLLALITTEAASPVVVMPVFFSFGAASPSSAVEVTMVVAIGVGNLANEVFDRLDAASAGGSREASFSEVPADAGLA